MVLLYSTLFFYSVGFVSGIDVQPGFILFAVIYIGFNISKVELTPRELSISVLLLVFFIAGCIVHSQNLDLKFILTYSIVILNVFTIYVLIKCFNFVISSKLVKVVFVIYASVGVVQFIYPEFLSFLVTRSVDAALSFASSGRGVRSLTAEPAQLGKVFTIISVIYFLVVKVDNKDSNRKVFCWLTIMLLATILISRSAYAIVIHSFIYYILVSLLSKRYFSVITVLSVFGMMFLSTAFFIIAQNYMDIRSVKIIYSLFNNPEFILSQGAFRRVINIPITFDLLGYYGFWGAGNIDKVINGWIPTPIGTYFYTMTNRAYGGYFEWLLKFGVLGLPFVLTIFYFCTASIFKFKGKRVAVIIAIVIFQDGTPVLPLLPYVLILNYFLGVRWKKQAVSQSLLS